MVAHVPTRPVQLFVDELKEHGKEADLRIMSGGHAGSGIPQTVEMVETWLDFATPIVGLAGHRGGAPSAEDQPDQ